MVILPFSSDCILLWFFEGYAVAMANQMGPKESVAFARHFSAYKAKKVSSRIAILLKKGYSPNTIAELLSMDQKDIDGFIRLYL